MIPMADIAPTITAFSNAEYRAQIEQVQEFATRLHIDFMDGELAPTKSPAIEQAWWPIGIIADLHVMYKRPLEELETIISLQPSLVIIHAEAEGASKFLEEIEGLGISRGLALLSETSVEEIKPLLPQLEHVLIFSGSLGHFGGTADMNLLTKVEELKRLSPDLEIGWDGGINAENARQLVAAGVDVLNVGGFIHQAADPIRAYAKLEEALAQKGTMHYAG